MPLSRASTRGRYSRIEGVTSWYQSQVHDVFHVSQLRKCFKTPDRTVNFEDIELQEDIYYREHPVAILEETECKTRNKSIKFLKVKWSHQSDREATWEREDHLRGFIPFKLFNLSRFISFIRLAKKQLSFTFSLPLPFSLRCHSRSRDEILS